MTESLNDQFAALHAERVRTWDPERLARNVEMRASLAAAFDPAAIVGVGDRVEPFTLLDVDGGTLTLDALVADGPAVLVFFRFADCPACNVALPYYQRTLWPHLQPGVRLVAISPQAPAALRAIKRRHQLGYTVASDPDNRLAAAWRLTFPAGASEITADGALPYPAVVIVDADRTVRFVDASPDWLVRAESPLILAALGELRFASGDERRLAASAESHLAA